MINLKKYNRHWESKFLYPYSKKRRVLNQLINALDKKQIIEIIGLRRVGKTVLMLQMINYLIEKKTDPFNILYFTFDEEQINIDALLQNYQTQTKIDIRKEKIFIFLDEIQKLNNFQNKIKVYYDLYPNLKFIISGSTSLFIKKRTQESLAGRVISYYINPLSFDEYLLFTEKEEILKRPILYSEEIEREFLNYLGSQFIETIKMKDELEKKEYLTSILKKVVFEDLITIFSFENPTILYQIVKYIAQNPGLEINNLHLASELKISNKTLSLYLFYLENSFLIKKLYNFSRNLVTSERKLKKYYLASPSFVLAMVDFADEGKIFENYLVSLNDWRYFYRDSYQHEVDFVITDDNQNIIPVEAKFKKEIKRADLNHIFYFMKRHSLKKGVVFYRGLEKKQLHFNDELIQLMPYFEGLWGGIVSPP